MLSEWERQQWRAIEQSLAPSVVDSAQRERRRAALTRATFPNGYLSLALVYTLLEMGGAFLPLLGEVALLGLGLWLFLELRLMAGARSTEPGTSRTRWGRTPA
jgi:hypothetical protein